MTLPSWPLVILAATACTPPASDLASLLPAGVVESIETLWGLQDSESTADGFSSLLGGGAFSDNTVGISERGDIYVIGGGLDENPGALVQIRVEGTPGGL